MRKLIMKMSVSLDGFVAGSDGRKDWVFTTGDEESLAWSVDKIRQTASSRFLIKSTIFHVPKASAVLTMTATYHRCSHGYSQTLPPLKESELIESFLNFSKTSP